MVVPAKVGGSRGNSTVYCRQDLRGYCTAFDGWLRPTVAAKAKTDGSRYYVQSLMDEIDGSRGTISLWWHQLR